MAAEQGKVVARWLKLLWPGQLPPARGPKPSLSVGEIVRAGIEIADRDGLAALSMRGVAEALGFSVMSLYRHVPGKEELIEVMLDTALGEPPAPDPQASWRVQLTRWARANAAVLQLHPWLLEAVVSRAPIGPNRLRWFDTGLQAVSALGLSARDTVATVLLVDSYVRGAAQVSVGLTRANARTGMTQAEWRAIYAGILEQVVTAERYPALAAVAAAGALGRSDAAAEHFEYGLVRVLDGIEARAPAGRTRARGPRGGK
jgi:AcrR family transcriptional regulator